MKPKIILTGVSLIMLLTAFLLLIHPANKVEAPVTETVITQITESAVYTSPEWGFLLTLPKGYLLNEDAGYENLNKVFSLRKSDGTDGGLVIEDSVCGDCAFTINIVRNFLKADSDIKTPEDWFTFQNELVTEDSTMPRLAKENINGDPVYVEKSTDGTKTSYFIFKAGSNTFDLYKVVIRNNNQLAEDTLQSLKFFN